MKKCMAILLAAVLVLSLSVSAFANDGATIPPINNNDNPWKVYPGNPGRDQETVAREVPVRNTVVIEIGPMEEPEEDNPTTGAPVISFIPAAAVICGAALLLRKKK